MKKRILTEDDKTSIDTSIKKLNNNFLNTDKTVKQIRADLDTTSDKATKLSTKLETVDGKATNASKLTNDVHTGRTLKFWTGTQAEYDAIGTKDGNTLYLIKEKA